MDTIYSTGSTDAAQDDMKKTKYDSHEGRAHCGRIVAVTNVATGATKGADATHNASFTTSFVAGIGSSEHSGQRGGLGPAGYFCCKCTTDPQILSCDWH